MRPTHFVTHWSVFVFLAGSFVIGGEESPPTKPDRLKRASEMARRIQVSQTDAANKADAARLELIDRPLLTYEEPARGNAGGTLWAWGKSGRPLAILELWRDSETSRRWMHCVTLTSPGLREGTTPIGLNWKPKRSPVVPQALPEKEPPAPTERLRLRQMKELASRLTAHEFLDPMNSRYELRLLIQPVLRFSDPQQSIHDGAVFVFAHGTNPELIVMLEVLGDTPEKLKSQFLAARSSHAELHLEFDKQELWTCRRAGIDPEGPAAHYWLSVAEEPPE